MTSRVTAYYFVFLFLVKMAGASSPHPDESSLRSANVGDDITLQCSYELSSSIRIFWYKQSLGQKPKVMSTFYAYNKNGSFHNEFMNDPRFGLVNEKDAINLKITNLSTSDSASYYCGRKVLYATEFSAGTFLSVKRSGLNIPALVHQSASKTTQPGGSVTLSCTVHTGTCNGQHSVYWFKSSEESHPGLIYTHGGRNDQCEKKPHTQTHTCVYNMAMESLNVSHAGTYYCAVVSCGHIVFGNGTTLTLRDEGKSSVLVYFLSGALTATTILSVVLLTFLIRKHYFNKRNGCKCTVSNARVEAATTTSAEEDQHEENIHYAALSQQKVNRSRRQRNSGKTECVYSRVNH